MSEIIQFGSYLSKADIMNEFKDTKPVPSFRSTLPEKVPILEQKGAKDENMAETGLPKKMHVLPEKQKENLALGQAIARKNREEKVKLKLDEMVNNYLQLTLYATKESKALVGKKKRVNKKRPFPYITPYASEKSKDTKTSWTITSYHPLKSRKDGERLPV